MDAVLRSVLVLVSGAVVVGCADGADDGVGIFPRTFHAVLAGTIVARDGEGVPGASVKTTTFLPTVAARDSIGSCRGLAGSTASDVSDAAGKFVRRITWIQPGPLCVALEVSAAIGGTVQHWIVSLDSVWLTGPLEQDAARDTVRVFIIVPE